MERQHIHFPKMFQSEAEVLQVKFEQVSAQSLP